jgi:hypothetical protein
MFKKLPVVAALVIALSLPLVVQARDGGHGGREGGGGAFNAPEIDGADFVLAMTLLTGVVGLVRRRSQSK